MDKKPKPQKDYFEKPVVSNHKQITIKIIKMIKLYTNPNSFNSELTQHDQSKKIVERTKE